MTEQFLEQSVDEFPGIFRLQRQKRAVRTYDRVTRALQRWCEKNPQIQASEQTRVFVETIMPRKKSLLPHDNSLSEGNPARVQMTSHAFKLLADNVKTMKEVAHIETSIGGDKVNPLEWQAFLRAADKYTEEERA